MTRPRWLFAGQGPMGAAALEELAGGLPPVAVLTAEPSWGARPVADTAAARDLEVHHVDRIGPEPARHWPDLFADLDVGVCCCWAERLEPETLAATAEGWLNLHPSALPAWRGADPVAWQLLTSPATIGASVHRMTAAQDEGPIVAAGSVPVEPADDRGALLPRSGAELGRLAAGVLSDLAGGRRVAEHAQPVGEATSCPPPGVVPLVDPRGMAAAGGARVARAFSPRPGVAVATLRPDERFGLMGDGGLLERGDEPGSVTRTGERAVAIAFRDRWLRGEVWSADAPEPAVTRFTDPGTGWLPGGPHSS